MTSAWRSKLEAYLEYHRTTKGTSIGYRNVAKTYLTQLGERFDPESFNDLDKAQMMGWIGELRERNLSEATLKTVCGHVRTFYRWLNEGETPRFLRGITIGRNRSRIQTKDDLLSDSEFNRLVNASRPRDQMIFQLLRWTGARPTEVLQLRGKDIKADPKGGFLLTFRDTKNTETRIVPLLNPDAVKSLEDHLEIRQPKKDDYIFPGRKVGHFTEGGLWQAMRRAAKHVGIGKRIYPYMLRHQRATDPEIRNAPQGMRDQLMGWKSDMWRNYEHLETDDLTDYLRKQEGTQEVPLDGMARIEELERKVMLYDTHFDIMNELVRQLVWTLKEEIGVEQATEIVMKTREISMKILDSLTIEELEDLKRRAEELKWTTIKEIPADSQ